MKKCHGKIIIFYIIFVITIITNCFISLSNETFKGSGNKENPFIIETEKDLFNLSESVNNGNDYKDKYFVIERDITFDKIFTSIGQMKENENNKIYPFSGILDGKNHILTLKKNSKPIFSYCRNAIIKNINIKSEYINGFALIDNYVMDLESDKIATIDNVNILSGTKIKNGGYVGVKDNYKFGISSKNTIDILNCSVEKNVNIGVDENGVSLNYNKIGSFASEFVGSIKNCKSSAKLFGNNYVAGICAVQSNAMGDCILDNNTFEGEIISDGMYVGGILAAGYNKDLSAPNAGNVIVLNNTVSNNALITGNDYVGGIVGNINTIQNWKNKKTEIKNNLFLGKIKCDKNNKGLLVGKLKSINKYTEIEGNKILDTNENKKLLIFGYIDYIDTNRKNLKVVENLKYIDTSKDIDNLDVIDMDNSHKMTWQKNHNREDDPLFNDIDKLVIFIDNIKNYVELKCELLDEDKKIIFEDGMTALSILYSSDLQIYTRKTIYGEYIYKINELEEKNENGKSMGWVYYVNGEFGMVAADKYKLKKNDIITWKYSVW